jgi:hypothetical protein
MRRIGGPVDFIDAAGSYTASGGALAINMRFCCGLLFASVLHAASWAVIKEP